MVLVLQRRLSRAGRQSSALAGFLIVPVSRQRQRLGRTATLLKDERLVMHPGKVQAIHQVAGRGISAPKGGKIEVLLGKAQDRGELERGVVDVMILCVVLRIGIGADDQEGDAKAIAQAVNDGRRHLIVEAAPIVPGQEDDGIAPRRASLNRIDHIDRPVFPGTRTGRRMLAIRFRSRDPGEGRQCIALGIRGEVLPGHHPLRPQIRIANGREAIQSVPHIAGLRALWRIKLPRYVCRFHLVCQRREGEAGKHLLPVEQLRGSLPRSVATPGLGLGASGQLGISNGAMRLVATRGAGLVAVGAPEDRPIIDAFRSLLPGVPVLDLCGKTSLTQLTAVLAASDVVLSNDTGPLHLAAASGARVVGIYTCTSPSEGS